MTSVQIEESGMIFGPFDSSECFQIEKSKLYARLQNDLRTCEFVLFQAAEDRLLFVEAKKSAPRPDSEQKQKQKFDDFITQVAEKLVHSLNLSVALLLGRHNKHADEIPESFKGISFESLKILLILVLKDHPPEALAPLRDDLQKKLKYLSKTWPLQVVVLNSSMARTYKLIQ